MPLLAGILAGWEIVLILAIAVFLFGSKRLPPAIGRMLAAFRDAIDETSADAGRSFGGIYGRRAAEALTPDNQTAELYRPAAFEKPRRPQRSLRSYLRRIYCFLRGIIRRVLFGFF